MLLLLVVFVIPHFSFDCRQRQARSVGCDCQTCRWGHSWPGAAQWFAAEQGTVPATLWLCDTILHLCARFDGSTNPTLYSDHSKLRDLAGLELSFILNLFFSTVGWILEKLQGAPGAGRSGTLTGGAQARGVSEH